MFLTNLFNFKKKCTHEKVSPNIDFGYCPDCGKLVRNEWYITRCACCGVKLKTVITSGNIQPELKYCSNCGHKEFIIEKLDKISFLNVNHAVLKRNEITEDNYCSFTQCWQEKTNVQPKLLVQYL